MSDYNTRFFPNLEELGNEDNATYGMHIENEDGEYLDDVVDESYLIDESAEQPFENEN